MKQLISILFFLILISCGSQKEPKISVNFFPNRNLILQKENPKSQLSVIYIPFDISIKNNSISNDIRLRSIDHRTISGGMFDGLVTEFVSNDSLNIRFKHNFTAFDSYEKELYADYQIDLLDTSIKQEMRPFFDKMKKNNEKFGKILSLEEFKKQCPYTYKKIIQYNKRFLIVDLVDDSTGKGIIVENFPIKF